MLRQLVFFTLLCSLSVAHRFKGAEHRQTLVVEGHVDHVPTRLEADGYEECASFTNYTEGNSANARAANGMDHLLTRHMPRPLEDICKQYECLSVTKLESTGCGFSTMIIPSAYWMVADIDLKRTLGVREAYKRIYRVRSGKDNDRKLKMKLVVPIMKRYYPDENRAELGIYIPADYQSDPPQSTYDQVRIEKWDEMKVYARAYGGYIEEEEYQDQFDLLKEALENEDIVPDPKIKIEVGYTYMRLGRQRLEVMLRDENFNSD